MIHDDCNMAEEVNFQQATRAICCINLMNTIVIFLIKTVTRAVRRKVPEGFLVLLFCNNNTVYKFKRSELFQIFTQTESVLLKITLRLT